MVQIDAALNMIGFRYYQEKGFSESRGKMVYKAPGIGEAFA